MELWEFARGHLFEGFLTTVTAVLVWSTRRVRARVKREVDEQAFIKDGIVALLQYRLCRDMSGYIKRGFCDEKERRAIADMLASYENLGGNGLVREMKATFARLPYERMRRETDGGRRVGDGE